MKHETADAFSFRVRRCAVPIELSNGNSRAVLCLHGFTGYPGEMAYPAARLAENGWDVRVPRLSGHGTNGADFARTGIADWRRQAADEWLNLAAQYETVCVLGHSMGGLLTLDLARRHPVDSAAVMAPALGIRIPHQFWIRPLSRIVARKAIPWKPDPEYIFFDDRDEDDDEFLGREYWSWAWLRHLSELLDLQKETERHLADIRTPILGLFAERDAVVGSQGRSILEKRLSVAFESVELKGAQHYIPYDPQPGAKEAAMDAVLEWFERTGGSGPVRQTGR